MEVIKKLAGNDCRSAPQSVAKAPEQNYLGLIHRLSDAFPNKELPYFGRGALQGEGVCATYDVNNNDNYLYSLNAQTCIIVTLYNPINKKGAVIHFDHNIQSLIEKAVQDAMNQLGNSNDGEITATISGGIWLGDAIGAPVKSALANHGINPSWKQWSLSYCTSHCYGVLLDLKTGNIQVFDQSVDDYFNFVEPLLIKTNNKNKYSEVLTAEEQRADVFMTRCKDPVILENKGTFHFYDPENVFKVQPKVTEKDIEQKHIPIHKI